MNAIQRQVDLLTGEISQRLDLISTSQTKPSRCAFGAPLVAIVLGGKGEIRQSCCNHWECPVCGEVRAKQEYHRIVYGAEILAREHQLYFVTLTCRGKEMPLAEAEENYYVWTNRLLTTYRTHIRRQGGYWAYVQVTERQKKTRDHPHSHVLVTALPKDATRTGSKVQQCDFVSALFSRWNETAGLGSQHRISRVESARAVSRYVAKYLFKDTARDKFPPKWKRVRYSQNYPKPPKPVCDVSFILRDADQWRLFSEMRVEWTTSILHVKNWLEIRFPDTCIELETCL